MSNNAAATVIGGRGYIGSRLVTALQSHGTSCWVPDRDDPLLFSRDLGDVFYCAGTRTTSQARGSEMERAHAGLVAEVLGRARFRSFLYLSSTRVYMNASSGREDALLTVNPNDSDHVFNITKLAGESVCLSVPNDTVRVVRVSNVYGPGAPEETFLPSVVLDAVRGGRVVLRSGLDTVKDYISVEDCIEGLLAIQSRGTERLYNVASGRNTSHGEILDRLRRRTHAEIEVLPNARRVKFPSIDVTRFRKIVPRDASDLLDDLDALIDSYRTIA